MAQGKLKVKSKLPDGAKKTKKVKGSAITRRSNAPVRSKSALDKKMKDAVTKMVNKSAETQLRGRATENKKLSEAQKRVAAAPTAPAPANLVDTDVPPK